MVLKFFAGIWSNGLNFLLSRILRNPAQVWLARIVTLTDPLASKGHKPESPPLTEPCLPLPFFTTTYLTVPDTMTSLKQAVSLTLLRYECSIFLQIRFHIHPAMSCTRLWLLQSSSFSVTPLCPHPSSKVTLPSQPCPLWTVHPGLQRDLNAHIQSTPASPVILNT